MQVKTSHRYKYELLSICMCQHCDRLATCPGCTLLLATCQLRLAATPQNPSVGLAVGGVCVGVIKGDGS